MPLRPGETCVIDLPVDFRDLLREFLDADVEFVVVGGYAVAFHGHPRATKDLDLLVRATPSNAHRVYRALGEFGAPLYAFDVTEADFADYDGVLQIGLPPNRVDILNRISGVTFDEAVAEGSAFDVDGRRVPVIGLQALLTNKRATGRTQDAADTEALSVMQARRAT